MSILRRPNLASPIPPFLKVMAFIDGGYVRDGFKKMVGHDNINFAHLVSNVGWDFNLSSERCEFTRIYYYDGIVESTEDHNRHKQQQEYFHTVGIQQNVEVNLGRLVKDGKGKYRQKGVDILISVGMLAKAFQNFYDVALFMGGDDDFVDLINAVKNLTNKKVFGVAFEHNVSQRLLESFDGSHILTKNDCICSVNHKTKNLKKENEEK